MVSIFLDMAKKVGIFMIISQTLMHLGMAKTYEKYIRLVISFMAVAQIIFSFAAFFKIENTGFLECFQADFQEEWKQEVKVFDEQMQEIREKINEKIKVDMQESEESERVTEESERIKVTVQPLPVTKITW